MPNLYSPSPTISIRDYDPLADPSPTITAFVSEVPVVIVDNTPLSPIGMIAIKIYVFGGMALMAGIVLTSVAYWIWVVVIKREFADSPPGLDVHPERMREREKRRIERLKKRAEEKAEARKRRDAEKFRIPPLQYDKNKKKTTTTTTTRRRTAAMGKTRRVNHPPNLKPAMKPAIRKSTDPWKKKRVSWADCNEEQDKDGNLSKKPMKKAHTPPAPLSYSSSGIPHRRLVRRPSQR